MLVLARVLGFLDFAGAAGTDLGEGPLLASHSPTLLLTLVCVTVRSTGLVSGITSGEAAREGEARGVLFFAGVRRPNILEDGRDSYYRKNGCKFKEK